MKTKLLTKIAASSLVLGATLVGCQTTGRTPLASASKPVRDAASEAAGARAALAANQPLRAIPQAEAAVAASPQDASYRALLAKTYLASGRFASAETAYTEALTLDPAVEGARLSLALVQIALGRNEAARATLALVPARVPVADTGLAYALAGDRQRGMDMLAQAARADDATAKTRQNLALVYAMSGMWVEARSTAAMDIAADKVGDRMAAWAQFVQPTSSYDQVASLLGVKPVQDSGRPAHLALASPVAEPVMLAAEEPASAGAAQEAAPPATPQIETAAFDAPVEQAAVPLMSSAAADPSPFVKAPAQAAPMLVAAAQPAAQRPAPAAYRPAGEGRWVVQLGAFSSAARVEVAWERALDRLRALDGFAPSSTTFISTRRSATYYRLSIAGFGSRGEAADLCEKVKAVGGACFVRGLAGDAPVQWVSNKTPARA
jgi:Flp pilus assembly protein TadD